MQYQLYDLSPRPFSTIINNGQSFSTTLNHIQPDGWGDGTGTCWLAPLTWATGPPGSGTCSLSIRIYSSGKPSACNALPPSRSNLQASLVLLMLSHHPDLLFRYATAPIYMVPALPPSGSTLQASLYSHIYSTCSPVIRIYSSGKPGDFNALPSSGSTLQASLVLLILSRHPDLLLRQALCFLCSPYIRIYSSGKPGAFNALLSSGSTLQASLYSHI